MRRSTARMEQLGAEGLRIYRPQVIPSTPGQPGPDGFDVSVDRADEMITRFRGSDSWRPRA